MATYSPDFMRDFICKRGACRRTCCRDDWTISLSKSEYRANHSKKLSPECQALAEKGFCRNPGSRGDKDYAQCCMLEDGFCALLTEDKLCAWEKLRGESVGAVCIDFPRTAFRFLEDDYISTTVACEAAVELLLGKPDPIRLVQETTPPKMRRFFAEIDAKGVESRPLLKLYPDLLRWGFSLLQNRIYTLDDRFVLLANALSLIDWMERNGRVGELPGAMEKFLRPENLERIVKEYGGYTIGPKAFLAVNMNAFSRTLAHSRFREIARKVLEGLGLEILQDTEGRLALGQRPVDSEVFLRRKSSMAGIIREKETFLEHVMVCEFLRSMMPITEPGVWANFQIFNVCYALHKGMLYGSLDTPPSDEELVDAIVLVHRMFIHNYEINDKTLERLKDIQLTDLSSMVALIKG